MTEFNQSWDNTLPPQHKHFIDSFLYDNTSHYHRLIAPIGTGKMSIVTLITQELVQNENAKRFLYLLPDRAIVLSYKDVLKKLGLLLPVVYVDLRRFRELLINVPLDSSPWPSEILAILHIDTAKSSDVLETILKIEWDLIVSDSIPYQGNRSKVLIQLLQKKNAKRMLILEDLGQNIIKDGVNYRSHGVMTTRWTFNSRQLTDSARTTFKLCVIDYERSDEEIEFIKGYIKLAEQTTNNYVDPFIRPRLVSSSLYAAEQSLRQIRNRYAHTDSLSFLNVSDTDVFEENQAEDEFFVIQPQEKMRFDPVQILTEIQHLLDALNLVETDSKFDAFMDYIGNENQFKRVLVQSSYAATISYLYSSLNEIWTGVHQILGSFSKENIYTTFNRFRSEGHILIASTAVLAGMDFDLDAMIFYDTLNNPILVSQSISRLFSHNLLNNLETMPIQKKIIAFRDKSRVIPSEEKRLKQFQRIVRQLSR